MVVANYGLRNPAFIGGIVLFGGTGLVGGMDLFHGIVPIGNKDHN